MLDIETLGLDPGASIVAIGAVRFSESHLGDTFQRSISLASCENAGLTIDAETLEWWLTQDELAKDQLVDADLADGFCAAYHGPNDKPGEGDCTQSDGETPVGSYVDLNSMPDAWQAE